MFLGVTGPAGIRRKSFAVIVQLLAIEVENRSLFFSHPFDAVSRILEIEAVHSTVNLRTSFSMTGKRFPISRRWTRRIVLYDHELQEQAPCGRAESPNIQLNSSMAIHECFRIAGTDESS